MTYFKNYFLEWGHYFYFITLNYTELLGFLIESNVKDLLLSVDKFLYHDKLLSTSTGVMGAYLKNTDFSAAEKCCKLLFDIICRWKLFHRLKTQFPRIRKLICSNNTILKACTLACLKETSYENCKERMRQFLINLTL